MKATRRQAREWAVQMLVAADLNPSQDLKSSMDSFWELAGSIEENGGEGIKGKLRDFAEERFLGVMECKEEIDETLSSLLANWDLSRLGTVERAVLRMGVWELAHSGVPKAVAINEAIDLVNWFSSPKSRTIVNGVLDKYAKLLPATR